ncbi:hypothetical protein EAI_01208 [Harpegnathos saltator]|uniref:Uncharacterized protein n=1 Tax=Harpegnathos saltator TaxID=610380 RepID=E2BEU9_HARSA|nr:hypothetical protein EAI_01208 [Harpegnathos saltator]
MKGKKKRRKREDEAGPSRASPAPSDVSVASTVLMEEDPAISDEAPYSVVSWNKWDEERELALQDLLCKERRTAHARKAEITRDLRLCREEMQKVKMSVHASNQCREVLLQGMEDVGRKLEKANKAREKAESSLVAMKEEMALLRSQLDKAREDVGIERTKKRPQLK